VEAQRPDRANLIHADYRFVWFSTTITLYDLTNTISKASAAQYESPAWTLKEKRTDCPLVTLGLVLDGSGFVRRSQTFAVMSAKRVLWKPCSKT